MVWRDQIRIYEGEQIQIKVSFTVRGDEISVSFKAGSKPVDCLVIYLYVQALDGCRDLEAEKSLFLGSPSSRKKTAAVVFF